MRLGAAVIAGAVVLPDREEFARRWSLAHGGADPQAPLVAGYLVVVRRAALPLAAARVPPAALTLAGLVLAAAALAPAAAGERWSLLVAALVAGSALLDGLDGAVAVLSGRCTRWGAVLDALADRLAESAFCAALWLLGAPGWLAVAAGATGWLHEYVRARATAAGMVGVSRITVGERPTRVVVTAAFALGAGLWPGWASGWAAAGAWAGTALGVGGLAQLLATVRGVLR